MIQTLILPLVLGLSIPAFAKLKTIEMTCEGCECRYTFDADKYSEEQIRNASDMFIHGPGILGTTWMMKKGNKEFLPYEKIKSDIETEKQKIKAFKEKKIPKELNKYLDKALSDFDFSLWQSEVIAEYIKTKNLSALRKNYKLRDLDKECGVILDFLEGKVKSSKQVVTDLVKNCNQQGLRAAICNNISSTFAKTLDNKNIAESIYFVWSSCVNNGHKRFEIGDIMEELGVKTEAFDCVD